MLQTLYTIPVSPVYTSTSEENAAMITPFVPRSLPQSIIKQGHDLFSKKLASILARLAGFLMLVAAAALLHSFVANPRGTLPWAPQSWSGGPLLLGSAFLGIQGAYLLVVCRFSLSGVIAAGLASGAFAAVAQRIVSGIKETQRMPAVVRLADDRSQEKFISRSRTMLAPERLEALINDLDSSGYQTTGIDFDSVTITYTPSKYDNCYDNPLFVALNFSYSPYIHPRQSETRALLSAYARLVNSWIVAKVQNHSDKAAKSIAELVYRQLYPGKYHQVPLFGDLDSSLLTKMRKTSSSTADLRQNLHWLAEREPDRELKSVLKDVCMQFDELEQTPPVQPPPRRRPQAAAG
jgi:hypothetical protein